MKIALPFTLPALALLIFAAPASPQRFDDGVARNRVPDLNGVWYLSGDRSVPCSILQGWPANRVELVNEKGQTVWGSVSRDRIWVPQWQDSEGRNGLEGKFRGDIILWANGSYWTR